MANHPGLFDRLGQGVQSIFGGRADPRLSAGDNKAAASEGLVNAGLATILASGRDGFSPTTLQALAQGLGAGRAAGGAARDEALDVARQEELSAAIDSGGFDTQELFLKALSLGDIDSARLLGSLAQTEAGRATNNIRFKEGIGPEGLGIYRVDARGNLLDKILDVQDRQSAGQRFGPVKAFRSAEDGKRFMGVWDAQANDGKGGVIRAPGIIPDTTVGERTQEGLGQVGLLAQQALTPELNSSLSSIRTDLAASKNPLVSTAANFIATDEQQIAMPLANTFLNVTVRWLSGAQMTDQERTNYRIAMIPRGGDREFGIRVKIIMQEAIAEAMAAGVWRGEATVDANGNQIADVDNVTAWVGQAQIEAINQVVAEMQAEGQAVDPADVADVQTQGLFDSVSGRGGN